MASPRTAYVCGSCGARFPKWMGRCTTCQAWNTLSEEVPDDGLGLAPRDAAAAPGPAVQAQTLAEVDRAAGGGHQPTGLAEVDRVLGGGLLPGAVVLLGGDPGIGKSTLVLQLLHHVATAGRRVFYVTGEESAAQIRSRAERLGLDDSPVQLLAEVTLERMAPEIERTTPHLLVVDSIQTVRSETVESAAGSVSQVRACAARLIHLAKTRETAVLLIGHVTKEGALAGPRTLEHMVDVVLYLEGDGVRAQRILRSVKNRFGTVNEIGLFRMTAGGLVDVANPSALFLQERAAGAPGTVVFAGLEGTRPLLIEIQALVGDSATAYPTRTAAGMDGTRVALLQAVIEKHLGDVLTGLDIYLNIVGGLRLGEPALDAAVVAAMLSSFRKRPIAADTAVFGEIGLTGELRGVSFTAERLAEAARQGFCRVVMPRLPKGDSVATPTGLTVVPVADIAALAEALWP